jgi:DNA-binding XRE family transcriptional regulator
MTPTQTSHPGRRWFTVVNGHKLRRLRNQRGLSQEQLAHRAGISPDTVARLERQPAVPCRSRTLGRLAPPWTKNPPASPPPPSPELPLRLSR